MPLEDKDGNKVVSTDQQQSRWKEYFDELLNIPGDADSKTEDDFEDNANTNRQIRTTAPTITETVAAIKKLKNNKAPGTDNIAAELFKVSPTSSATAINDQIISAWNNERFDNEWKNGVIVKVPKKANFDINKPDM